jgi:hypothetical protein
LLLGSSLLEEESNAVRLAMADAMSCTHLPEAEQQTEHEVTTTSWWRQDQDSAPSRVDARRSQCGSLVPADSRQLYCRTLSGLFAASASLSLYRASQATPSLQPGLSLAGDASLTPAGARAGAMSTSHLGEGHSLKFAPMGLSPTLSKRAHLM